MPSKAPRRPPPAAALTRLADLVPDPSNRRRHTPRNLGMVADALREVGAARSIVIDEDDVILAGNGVTEAAPQAGITKLRVIEAEGDEIIAVRRRGLTPDQKRALALYDNRTAELAEWNFELLQADKDANLALQPFWTPEEEAALFAATEPVVQGKTPLDDIPAPRATTIQPGDLFALGPHRLLCGDATDPEAIARLTGGQSVAVVATSPPYANQRRYGGGDFDWDAIVPPALLLASAATRADGAVLVNLGLLHHDGRVVEYWRTLFDALAPERPLYGWYVWDKGEGRPGDQHGRLASAHEWVFHFAKQPRDARKVVPCKGAGEVKHHPGKRSGLRGTDDVVSGWTHEGLPIQPFKVPDSVLRVPPAKGGADGHPAPFSVAFAEALVAPFSEVGEVVVDPFCGAGTLIIAATRLQRVALGIEIHPPYCQMVIDRWEAFTGERAQKVA